MKKNVTTYFHTNIFETTSGNFATELLQFHINQIGLDRIMYSIDYPYVSRFFFFVPHSRGYFFNVGVGGNTRWYYFYQFLDNSIVNAGFELVETRIGYQSSTSERVILVSI